MPKKITIYVSDDLRRAIGSLPDGTSLSGRLAAISLRYETAVLKSAPMLPLNEWMSIVHACNGLWQGDDPQACAFIWAEIADCEGLGSKWEIDAEALSQKLRTLPYASQMAVGEIVERYWRAENKSNPRELLLICGAKIESDNTQTT